MVDKCIPIIGLHNQSLYSLVGKSWIDDNVNILLILKLIFHFIKMFYLYLYITTLMIFIYICLIYR